MAPEMIRNEPCSARVDVWSYGVVLWELLSGEVPYKVRVDLCSARAAVATPRPRSHICQGVDMGAIIWGVGSNMLHLPVPSTTPEGFALLLKQCW